MHGVIGPENADETIATGQLQHAVAKEHRPRKVCETGFNAGHSAIIWLESSTTQQLVSFDLCVEHPYTALIDAIKRFAVPLDQLW